LKRFVLDASVAVAWCFEDECDAVADAALDLLESAEAVVPPTWPIEVGNALLAGERRKRITAARTARALANLRNLSIRLDKAREDIGVNDLVSLARDYKLSVYDAAYLSLAIREGIPLATLDRRLADTAKSAGVELVGP
jgi:predicted nucleic acid-binding protein